jgi:hypothetical protein
VVFHPASGTLALLGDLFGSANSLTNSTTIVPSSPIVRY